MAIVPGISATLLHCFDKWFLEYYQIQRGCKWFLPAWLPHHPCYFCLGFWISFVQVLTWGYFFHLDFLYLAPSAIASASITKAIYENGYTRNR